MRAAHQMSPTGRAYNGYNTAASYGYTTMTHSASDYTQGMQLQIYYLDKDGIDNICYVLWILLLQIIAQVVFPCI